MLIKTLNPVSEKVIGNPKIESMWHCDGWSGAKFKNEKAMKAAVKDL